MTARWEYLAVVWSYSREPRGEESVFRQSFHIHRGRGKDEERPYWTSEDRDKWGPTLIDLFNELGAEGWELTNDAIQYTRIASEAEGWAEVGMPVRQHYIFKRPLEDR